MGGIDVAVHFAFAQTPFIADRAAEVVMADPTVALVALTDDKEMRHAVGQFIDSFKEALAIYVMQCPPGHEQDSRVHAAWSHAINILSDRPPAISLHAVGSTSNASLSETEAKLFWRSVFERALPQVKVPGSEMKVNIEYPVIPTDIDPQETFEWNPAAMVPPDIEKRNLPVTNLDSMIAAPYWLYWLTRQEFHIPKPETQAFFSAPIWSVERLENVPKVSRHVQEGMIATALLVVSSKIEGSKLLASPFPSESNVRYPSLFLDHDFLLSSDILSSPSNLALSFFINIIPPALILQLTTSALDALSRTPVGSTKLASAEHTAYQLLILLSKSDRPHLAMNLIVRTILNRPDASSWHRQLLSQNLLRNLAAGQAQDTISLFASSIIKVLEHQVTSSSSQEKAEGSEISPDRYVKVTTVKFLAQFLDDADFLSPEFCVDILSKLFKIATHVDIRVAILNSMISRLGRCADESSSALAKRLMSALEMAIPILGSLDERRQTQDVDWTEAEKTGKLPEVYDDGGMKTYPPMLDVLLEAIRSHDGSSNVRRTGLIERILLPTIEKSREQSARWVKMFTLKHIPAGQPTDMPSLPIRPDILVDLIEICSNEVPKYILDLYQQFFLTNILPPARLTKLNEKVYGDIELRHSNEGKYWLSLYGQGADISYRAVVIVSILTKTWGPSTISNGFCVSHVQEIVLEQANAVLQVSDGSFRHWNHFIAALEPPVAHYQSDQDREAWLANCKPVLLRIINRIDALRTPTWQRDRNRQPAVLPPTFPLRLWVLDYPQLNRSSDACALFVQQLVSVLQETIDLGLPYYDRLEEIESALSRCSHKHGMHVAHRLGSVELEDPKKLQENLLRVELAEGLLRRVKLPRDKNVEILRSIKAMLDAWQSCEMEDIRLRGIQLGEHLKL